MSYEPTNWKSGDVVTSAKLNKLEQGVASAGGGGVLVVHGIADVDGIIKSVDKTWSEIYSADAAFIVAENESVGAKMRWPVITTGIQNDAYRVSYGAGARVLYLDTDSPDGYPVSE